MMCVSRVWKRATNNQEPFALSSCTLSWPWGCLWEESLRAVWGAPACSEVRVIWKGPWVIISKLWFYARMRNETRRRATSGLRPTVR